MSLNLKEAITTNWPIKATALALAAVLWAAVAAQEPSTQLVDVTLVIRTPPGRVLAAAHPPVQALFTGTAAELFKLYINPPVIRVEIPDNHSGPTFSVDLSSQDLSLGGDAAVVAQDVLPRRIVLSLDSFEERYAPVSISSVIEADSGFEIVGDISIEPESILVSGPRTQVLAISEIPTDSLEMPPMRRSFTRLLPLDTVGFGLVTLSAYVATVSATIREVVTEVRMLPTVSIQITPRQGGMWRSDKPEVLITVSGPVERVTTMTRDSITVTATPQGRGPVETVPLQLHVPEGLTARATPDSVTLRRIDLRGS